MGRDFVRVLFRRIVIKRLVPFLVIFFILLVGVFFTASARDLRLSARAGKPDADMDIFSEFPAFEGLDKGLILYRNEDTKGHVEEFYTAVTGSSEIALAVLQFAEKFDIGLSLAFSLAWAESRYNPKAVNYNSSSVDKGLFQLNSNSFPHLSDNELFNPWANSQHGLKYLRSCLDLGGNEIVGLAMYNAGRNRVAKQGAPLMTLDYIASILDYQRSLERQFEERFFPPLLAYASIPRDANRLDTESKKK